MTFAVLNGLARLSSGAVAPLATVEVRRESDGALATIYSDEAGTSPITQPGFAADSNGRFTFYAPGLDHGYQIKITSADLSETHTWHNVAIGKAAQQDASTIGAQLINQADETSARELILAAHQSLVGVLANIALGISATGGALTIATKDASGATPSANSPAYTPVRSATATDGGTEVTKATAAESLTLASGSEMGAVAGKPLRLWVVLFNDGGTRRLGAINCLATVASASGGGRDVTDIYPLRASDIASSTAEGSGAADSSLTFYTGTAVTSKPFQVLGYAEWASFTTPGTWTAPDKVQMFGPGVPLPGQRVGYAEATIATLITGTTIFPDVSSVPQDTEGVAVASKAYAAKSGANALFVEAMLSQGVHTSTTSVFWLMVYRSLSPDAFGGCGMGRQSTASARFGPGWVKRAIQALSTASLTYQARAGSTAAGTNQFNGAGGVQEMAGALVSKISIEEVMA